MNALNKFHYEVEETIDQLQYMLWRMSNNKKEEATRPLHLYEDQIERLQEAFDHFRQVAGNKTIQELEEEEG